MSTLWEADRTPVGHLKKMKIRLDFIMNCDIIKINRGKDVKTYCLIKNGAMPLFYKPPQDGVDDAEVLLAPSFFSLRKETQCIQNVSG